jgi:TolB-like protein
MGMFASSEVFVFEGFRLDRRGGGLFRRDDSGVFVPVALGSRGLDILGVLIARAGEVVSKDEIIAAVWPGTVVEDSNLTVQISALRRVLDQGRFGGSDIQTIPGRGYRFVAPVTPALDAATNAISKPFYVPRLSIVVLPFTNLSNDPNQQYLADGITEDLTTDLSQMPNMFVISRNTAFTYRDKLVNTKQIGRDLGVRYVLEGSVQRLERHARVSAQLIDAETDSHLWAERFDRDIGDLFATQNEITSRIAISLNQEVTNREAARPTANPDALDYILRGRAAFNRPLTRESYAEIIRVFERALALDPRSVDAQSRLAAALVGRFLDEMSESGPDDIARAEDLIEQALAAAPRSPRAHFAKAQFLRATGRCEEAIPEYQAVLASDRNSVAAIAHIGRCKIYVGPIEEAIPLHEQAIHLSPRDPGIGLWYFRIAQAHLLQSHIDKAILWFEKARSASPAYAFPPRWLASAYALKGDLERAAVNLAEARRLRENDFPVSIAQVKGVYDRYFVAPTTRALLETTHLVGLRKAGVPEE